MSEPDTIVLSPHLDDAALSLGGLIHRLAAAGARVLVATFCTRAPEVARIPRPLRRFGDMETRRQEDALALARLHAEPRWLGFVERALREPRVPFRALFAPADPAEPGARARLTRMREAIEDLMSERPGARVLCPLGVGGHRDHRDVQRAGLEAMRLRRAEARFAFYEDFYALLAPAATATPAAPAATALEEHPLRAELQPLGPEDERAQLEALAAYASQLSALGGLSRLRALLARRHAALGGAVLLHRLAPAGA